MIKKVLMFLCIFGAFQLSAQELACKVVVNASQLKATTSGDKQIFTEIEQAISGFMNNQRWTTDAFSQKEKILSTIA